MISYTGEQVYPDIAGSHPSPYSIGVGLGRAPRFAGHTRDWYPVLAHVIVVAGLIPEMHDRIHGLLHDAPEAIVGDVPTTWKSEGAKENEALLLSRIYNSLGISLPTQDIVEMVCEADARALAAEAHVLGHPMAETYWPEVDQQAYQLTEYQLSFCETYLKPENAATVFLTALDVTTKAYLGN